MDAKEHEIILPLLGSVKKEDKENEHITLENRQNVRKTFGPENSGEVEEPTDGIIEQVRSDMSEYEPSEHSE
ncbi:hypothetical protein J6590_067034 [Homalodisca vitripennis]|nr:hypothetical protein J6590_098242 [Homalodisca vitripennis]KAG8310265.1 hypothetical protein J6590_067034 [Homalodisca vitripennis]